MSEDLPDYRDEERLPSRPAQDDDEAMREYGRQIAIHSLLSECYGQQGEKPHIALDNREPKGMSLGWFGVAVSVAALVMVGFFIRRPGTNTPTQIETPRRFGWNIEAVGDAKWERLSATRIALTQGELLVETLFSDSRPLTIETPNSTATAESTGGEARLFVGTHPDPSSASNPKPNETTKPMNTTRIFVLAGTVALANPSGTALAEPNQLVQTTGESAPTAIAVEVNADFGIRLFKQLAWASDKNIFLSPFSLTSALAMTVEGARGTTARSMGGALGFPEITRRTGEDSERIPWEVSKVHAGIAALRSILSRQEETPERQTLREEVESLQAEHSTLRTELRKFQQTRSSSSDEAAAFVKLQAHEQKIVDQINEKLPQLDPYDLQVANALWGAETYPFRKEFVDKISDSYGTGGAFSADFRSDPERARQRINEWSAEQTNDRIANLLSPGVIDRDTRLVIASAIYFRGEWATPFSERATRDRDFVLRDGKVVKTPTMGNLLDIGYAAFNVDGTLFETPEMVGRSKPNDPPRYPAEGGFMIAELPYRGNDLAMTMLVPIGAEGLRRLEHTLDAKKLDAWISQMETRRCSVRIPKFTMSSDLELKHVLKDLMGLKQAFQDPGKKRNGADFSGMTISKDPDEQFFISQVIHKTWIDVNEKGTEAAAVTVVVAKDEESADLRPFYPQFKADRPFLFFIRDRPTGAILFIGRVTDPR